MSQPALQSALQRAEHVFTKRPEAAQMHKVSTATVRAGTRCEFAEDEWRYISDMPEGLGGTATGPTPGTLIRAGLVTCLAIGYSVRAAYLGIPVRHIAVELHTEADLRGLFCGQAEVPVYSSIRYTVTIDSDASDADIERLINEGDARSPYLNLFRTAQTVQREVTLRRTAPAELASSAGLASIAEPA